MCVLLAAAVFGHVSALAGLTRTQYLPKAFSFLQNKTKKEVKAPQDMPKSPLGSCQLQKREFKPGQAFEPSDSPLAQQLSKMLIGVNETPNEKRKTE